MEADVKGSVILSGINHRTCQLNVRENYAISGEDLHHVLQQARRLSGVDGVVAVSTCNRTEFYCLSDGNTDVDPMAFFKLVEEMRQISILKSDMIYTLANENAVRHLFRVTSGMDSMVLGEPQITGQVKQALADARMVDSVGPVLGRLFEYAFGTAKEVRTRTGIGKGAVSVGYVAVELARKIFGNMKKTSMLLIGAGEIAEAAAKNLSAAGATNCVVTNRTFSRAVEVAEKFNWKAEPFEKLDDLMVKADIAVIAIGTGHYILDYERIKRIVKQRRYNYLFLIDLGVPRAVDPTVREQDNVFLYDVDDVEGLIHKHIEQRREFAAQAEAIIEQRIAHAIKLISNVDSSNLLSQMANYLEDVRTDELKKAMRAINKQPVDQVMDKMSKALIKKLFYPVFNMLKQDDQAQIHDLIVRTFLSGVSGKKTQRNNKKEATDEDQNSQQNQ